MAGTTGWHNRPIAVSLYGLPQIFRFVFSFVIVLVFVRFACCNFYFYIVFVFQIAIVLVLVLTERSAIVLVFVFVTKIALISSPIKGTWIAISEFGENNKHNKQSSGKSTGVQTHIIEALCYLWDQWLTKCTFSSRYLYHLQHKLQLLRKIFLHYSPLSSLYMASSCSRYTMAINASMRHNITNQRH